MALWWFFFGGGAKRQILYSLWVGWGAHREQQVIQSQPAGERSHKPNDDDELEASLRKMEDHLGKMQNHLKNWKAIGHGLVLSKEDFLDILKDTCFHKLSKFTSFPNALDLPCLDVGACLTDNIISFYMALLRTHADRKGNSKLAILDPQTLAKVEACLTEKESAQSSLKRMVWGWLVKNQNVKPDGDRVFIPCNALKTHWSLAEAIVPERKVNFYCSAGGKGSSLFHKPIEELFRTLATFPGYEAYGGTWAFEIVRGIPQQSDCCSCGLYTCAFADFLVDGKTPTRISARLILSLRAAQRELVAVLRAFFK